MLRLREARIRCELSATQVASMTDIGLQQLKMYELATQFPSKGHRKKLAEFFEIPEDELFRDIDRVQRLLLSITAGDSLARHYPEWKPRKDLWREPHERYVPDDD